MDKKKKAFADFIKKEWGVLYDKYSHLIDEDGWLKTSTKKSEMFDDWEHHLSEGEFRSLTSAMGSVDYKNFNLNHPDSHKIRPMSFRDFENNNGWICVNNKTDMPKEDCLVKICFDGKSNSIVYQWYAKYGSLEATQFEVNGYIISPYRFWIKAVSHYKIYVPDLPPMY